MNLPSLIFADDPRWEQPSMTPDAKKCAALWDRYDMMPHIRDHSRAVADVATEIARRAEALVESGKLPAAWRPASESTALAAALLHDIAKTYCIRHGGAHAQLGAAWVREETGNALLAQAVLFHVNWPWEQGPLAQETNPLRLSLIVSYADKRVRHAAVVTLDERFEDLLDRYGDTKAHRDSIRHNHEQARSLEQSLFALVGKI